MKAKNMFDLREQDFLSGHYQTFPNYRVYYLGKRVFLEGMKGVGFQNNLMPIKSVVRSGNDVIVELKRAKPISRKYVERMGLKYVMRDFYIA